MKIYLFLADRTTPAIARLVTGLYFALLITLAVFGAFEPQAEFRYGNI